MTHYRQQSSMGGSSTQPPSYRPEHDFIREQRRSRQDFYRYSREVQPEEDDEYLSDEAIRRPVSGVPAHFPIPVDSSRAIANGDHLNIPGNQAWPEPETPSAYSDPYEYNSTVSDPSKGHTGANVLSTRPEHEFLAYDPYKGQHSQGASLDRSNTTNTLGPGDSVSAVNVNAISRNLEAERQSRQQQSYDSRYTADPYTYDPHGGDETQDFHDPSFARGYYPYETSYDHVPLRNNSAGMGYAEDEYQENQQREKYWNGYDAEKYEHDDTPGLFANNVQGQYPVPTKEAEDAAGDRKGLMSRFTRKGPKPGWGGTLDEQITRRRKGVGRQSWPILTWILTIAYIVVFIIELILGKQKTGQAIQTSPSWNPMLGPSFEFLISFGARFVPCMRKVPDIPTSIQMACLQYSTSSSLTSNQLCPIWEICGLPNANTTNQAYRFITPIFIHAGFVHILFNLMVQLTLCAQIEKLISTPFYALVYFAGGIGGNLLGANFGLVGQPSVGASGAIYTCISVELIDLCYNWKYEYKPRTRLIVSICFAIIGFAIGLLPGLDNFAHIGGFAIGILGGLLFCPAIHATRRHRIITWILRMLAAVLLVGFFVGLATNFYTTSDPSKACPWCRYLSCLPTFSQCKGNGLTSSTTSSPS